MDDPSIAEKLVEALARPDGCPKLRPVHAIGIGATGLFVASDVAPGGSRGGSASRKANKIIAYELKLRESTVKVHIRNIMKKLKATNRTEVACKVNDLFPVEPLSRDRYVRLSGFPLNFET